MLYNMATLDERKWVVGMIDRRMVGGGYRWRDGIDGGGTGGREVQCIRDFLRGDNPLLG